VFLLHYLQNYVLSFLRKNKLLYKVFNQYKYEIIFIKSHHSMHYFKDERDEELHKMTCS